MKTYKKILLGTAAVSMALSMTALAACGGSVKSSGEIKGSYTEVTADDSQALQYALDNVDVTKVLGDYNDEKYKYGISVSAGIEVSAKLGKDINVKGNAGAEYKLYVEADDNSATGYNVSGKGNAELSYDISLSEKVTGGEAISESEKYKLEGYNDAQYLYGTYTRGEGENASKISAKFDYIVLAEDILPAFMTGGYNLLYAGGVDIPEASTLMQFADMYNVSVALDDKDGLKLKIGVNEESLWAILGEEVSETELEAYKKAISFKTCSCEFYFSLDKDGVFEAASAIVDVSANVDVKDILPAGMKFDNNKGSFSVKGKVILKSGGSKIKLPANIESDKAYKDWTDIAKGFIGGKIK